MYGRRVIMGEAMEGDMMVIARIRLRFCGAWF